MTLAHDASQAPARLFSGPPAYQASSPWGPWAALGACVLIILAQLVGALVAIAVLPFITGTTIATDDIASLTKPLGLAVMIGTQILSIAVVWWLAGRSGMRRDVLQLFPKSNLNAAIIGGILVVLLTGLVEALLYLFLKFDYLADSAAIAEGLFSPLWLGTVVMAVVFAPLWEELTFRGFLLSALAQTRLGFWPAALISNTLWTVLHSQYSIAGIISVFTAGLVLSWLMWRTGSIKVPIIAHGIANLFAVAFAYYMHAGAPVPA